MSMVPLRSLDLNLLRVLEALLEERSVTRSAARLGLTQSAVSHALKRLRGLLDDELFVRGPGGMQPTPRAEEVGAGVRRAMLQLQSALEPARFDPALTDRRFTLGGAGYVVTVLVADVLARLRVEAPRAEVRLRGLGASVAEDLDAGRMDLMVGAYSRVPDRFAYEPLFSDRLVWTLRAGHPAGNGVLTLERLAALPHLVLGAAEHEEVVGGSIVDHGIERRVIWDDGGVLRAELAARGLRRHGVMTVPDPHAALAIAAKSDMAALLPERLVRPYAAAWGLTVHPPPYDASRITIGVLWRKDLDSPALSWLRGLMHATAAAL